MPVSAARVRGTIALAVVLFAACAAMQASAQQLRILSRDATGLTLEYRPIVTMLSARVDGMSVQDITFEGAAMEDRALPGEPALRFRKELIAVPGALGNSARLLTGEFEDMRDIIIAPVLPDSMPGDGVRIMNGEGYRTRGFHAEHAVELRNVGLARDVHLADLHLRPVLWDAATRTLRRYTRMSIRIDFGPADPRIGGGRGTTRPGFGAQVLNPEQATAWRVREAPSPKKSIGASLQSGVWKRFSVREEGMYRLTRSWFRDAGFDVDGLDPRTIRVYNTGGRELPTLLTAARPAPLSEIPVEVVGEADGRFDEGDYVLVYARAVSGFDWDAQRRRYRHSVHRYTYENSFLVSVGAGQGARIQSLASTDGPAAFRPQWFRAYEFVNDEKVNILRSGKMWLSTKLNAGVGSLTYTRKLEGIDASQQVTYRMELWSQSHTSNPNSFVVRENGQALGTIPMPTVNLNTDRDDIAASSGTIEYRGPGTLPEGRSVITVTYSASDPNFSRGGYVNWIEWQYARQFMAAGDELAVNAPDTNALVRYEINGFSNSDVHVFDITHHDDVRRLTGASISGGTVRFGAAADTDLPKRYLVLAASAFRTPGRAVDVVTSDLLGSHGAEYVIISPDSPGFLAEARRLAAHRMRPADPISTMVVPLQSIYDEFNCGTPDPTAIRDFLAYAVATWSVPPRYVLLFGDGHYDYRQIDPAVNNTTIEPQRIPVWESENSVHLIDSYVSDDYYAKVVGADPRVDLAIGRIPVIDSLQAQAVVDKIIRYDSEPEYNAWRNRITFVADDGLTTRDNEYNQHTSQSELMATALPSEYEQRKIYIVAYRTENTAQGRRKPEAAQAIIDQLNDGTVLINYTGHGSESVWAHENVLSSAGTIPQLRNSQRPSFFVAATCTFGLYDHPNLRSGMELLMTAPDRGAIGGLTSPRVVFSNENSNYNRAFLITTINNGRDADGTVRRIGDGNYAAKQQWNNTPGYEKFFLMGDPAMRLALPRHRAEVESILINDQPVVGDTVQLKALSKVTINARILTPAGGLWSDFSGTATVSLFDAERRVPVEEWQNWEYREPGGLLYRGQATIRDGRFAVSLIVPKDISYENRTGRFAVYFDNSQVDGAGYSTGFRVGGTDSTAAQDDRGPDISLYLDSRSFQPGDLTGENPTLLVDLYDASGINTTGLGIGHAIELWIDGAEPGIVLNEYYIGEPDSWQRGSVRYGLRNVSPGTHTLKVRAWDIHNNSSVAETWFTVAESERLAVRNVFVYPNPMTDRAAFTFQHNQSVPVDVEIRIYTMAGRRVGRLEVRNVSDRFVQIPWNGTDDDGDRLANGVYFYKVVCTTADGTLGSEALGKFGVLR